MKMLSKARIKKEISSTEGAILKLITIQENCDSGIAVNKIVLEAFREELKKF